MDPQELSCDPVMHTGMETPLGIPTLGGAGLDSVEDTDGLGETPK